MCKVVINCDSNVSSCGRSLSAAPQTAGPLGGSFIPAEVQLIHDATSLGGKKSSERGEEKGVTESPFLSLLSDFFGTRNH